VLTGLPLFSGTVLNQTVADGQTIQPFSSVAVTDSAGLTIQGFTIVLYDSSSSYLNPTDANGTLSGAGLTQVGVGTYALTPGTPAKVSAELHALRFSPGAGSSATTDFMLSAFDGATTADNYDVSVTAVPATGASVLKLGGMSFLAGGGAAGTTGGFDTAVPAPVLPASDAPANPAPQLVPPGGVETLTVPAPGALLNLGVQPASDWQHAVVHG